MAAVSTHQRTSGREFDDPTIDLAVVRRTLQQQQVETPSWGYGNSGTRFGVFPQPGVPRTPEEKLEDAAEVHRLMGICPSVAIVVVKKQHVNDQHHQDSQSAHAVER